MKNQAGLIALGESELYINGGSCPSCHQLTSSNGGFDDGYSLQQIVDFFHGFYDGFTES